MRATASKQRAQRSARSVRQLRDLLRSDIVHGSTGTDGPMSETGLMIEHRATRVTVRKALALLKQEGWIGHLEDDRAAPAGQGTPPRPPELVRLQSAVGIRTPPGWRTRVLESTVVPLPRAAARRLGTVPGECLRIEYLSSVDDDPAAVVTNYVLFPEAQSLVDMALETDWWRSIEAAGIEIGGSDVLITTVGADAALASLFAFGAGSPLRLIEQVTRNGLDRPFNFSVMYLRDHNSTCSLVLQGAAH